ncbi:hypothetical protein GCM10027074_14140 [Streptomyces deserti]
MAPVWQRAGAGGIRFPRAALVADSAPADPPGCTWQDPVFSRPADSLTAPSGSAAADTCP